MTIKPILAAFIMLCLHYLYLSLSFCIFNRFLLCCHQHSGFFAILERKPGHYNHRLSQCADQKHPISNYNHMPRYQCCKTFFNGTDREAKYGRVFSLAIVWASIILKARLPILLGMVRQHPLRLTNVRFGLKDLSFTTILSYLNLQQVHAGVTYIINLV